MKKILQLFLALTFSGNFLANAQCVPTFFDGFESGSYSPTWSMGAGLSSGAVTTTNPYAGTYRLEGTGGTSTHLTGFSTTIPSSTPNYISWSIYPTGTGAANYMVLGNSAVSATNCIAFCYWQGGTNIRFVSSTTNVYPCSPNAWYHIEMRNINFVSHTFDIWINGVQLATNFPFRNSTQNDLSRIHLYNFNSAVGVWDNIQIGTGNPPILSAVSTPSLCYGDSTGAIDLSVSGGSPGYTYSWSTTDTTQDISGLSAGAYNVTVTDGIGCQAFDTISVSSPPQLMDSVSISHVLCFGDSSATIDLTPYGGSPGYSYLWTSGDSTQDISGIPAGMYYLTLSDTNGCSRVDSFLVNEPAQITLNDSVTWPLCFGDSNGVAMINPSGGVPGYSFLWSTGDTTSSISGLPAGGYLVTVTDQNGCNETMGLNVSQPAPISVSDSLVEPACFGGNNGNISVVVSGGTPVYTYDWSSGDSTSSIAGSAGSYTLTITDDQGCQDVQTFTLTEPTELTGTGIVTDAPGGLNGAVNYTPAGGTPGYTFTWSNGSTTEDISGLVPGTYTVTVTDANLCQTIDTFIVSFIASLANNFNSANLTVYPNPFSNEISWEFNSTFSGEIKLQLTDIKGVNVVAAQTFSVLPGINKISLKGVDLPSGIYFYSLSGEGIVMSGKVVRE